MRSEALRTILGSFATSEDHIPVLRSVAPTALDGLGKRVGCFEPSATLAVGPHKNRVAETASGDGAILFATAPKIAAGKAAKDGCSADLPALALERRHVAVSGLIRILNHKNTDTAMCCRSEAQDAVTHLVWAVLTVCNTRRSSGSLSRNRRITNGDHWRMRCLYLARTDECAPPCPCSKSRGKLPVVK